MSRDKNKHKRAAFEQGTETQLFRGCMIVNRCDLGKSVMFSGNVSRHGDNMKMSSQDYRVQHNCNPYCIESHIEHSPFFSW